MNEHKQRLIASIANLMPMMCVHNAILEDIHAGIEPVSRTRDVTEVMAIDANGRLEKLRPEVSRIKDEDMGRLMRQAANRLYMFHA